MAFDPLDPAPRLPEDTTVLQQVNATSGELFGIMATKDGVYQMSLFRTRSPGMYAAGWGLSVFDKTASLPQTDAATLEAAARTTLQLIDQESPETPQR